MKHIISDKSGLVRGFYVREGTKSKIISVISLSNKISYVRISDAVEIQWPVFVSGKQINIFFNKVRY
jgi:hypothetical protein